MTEALITNAYELCAVLISMGVFFGLFLHGFKLVHIEKQIYEGE